jgi:cell division protein FtsL
MNERQYILVVVSLLFIAVLSTAIGIVYSKHQTRKLFVELQQLEHQVVSLNTEWGKLQLEQAAWAEHGRVERIALQELDMTMPAPEKVVYIKP